jgi:hypothetical protein
MIFIIKKNIEKAKKDKCMAKYPGRAILVENSDYFQFDLPLNHFLF